MNDCIFCKIFKNEIPSKRVFENENVIAFNDLRPLAQTHVLFIHKNHSKNINEMVSEPKSIADIFNAIKEWTKNQSLEESGFRVVTNCGPNAGQTVFHTHFHVLAGEPLGSFGR